MPTPTSQFVRGIIVALRFTKKSLLETQKILEEMGYSASFSTITRIFTQWENEDESIPQKPHGRPSNYDDDEKQRWVNVFKETPGLSVRKFVKSNELNPQHESDKTVRTALHASDLFPYKIPTLFPLNEDQKQARFDFALKKKKWKQKWNSIIFSDESYISAQMNGKQVCWAEDKKDIPEEMYQKLERYPLKVSVWGMIDNTGGLKIERLHGILNSEKYVQVLERNLLEVESLLSQKKIFQHDSAKPHTAHLTTDWLDDNGIVILQWPSKSPDLNLIEGVWAMLKDLVWQNQQNIENEDQLFDYVQDQFYNNQDVQLSIQNSYLTMYKRIEQVIENQGSYIKF